jgi:tetratricopeptide (TPR) repeat protein
MDQAEKLVLARAHLRAERNYSALSLLHDIQTTEENTAELRLMQALAYFKLEDYPHATTAIEQAYPQSPGLQILLAYLYFLVGDLQRASFLADSLAHQHGTLPEIMLLRGNISLIETLHLQQQLDGYVKANHDPVAWLILGHVYCSRADYARAEIAYRQATASPRPNVLPYYAMAQVEVGQGNRRQAIAYLVTTNLLRHGIE